MGWVEGPVSPSLLGVGLVRQPLPAMRFGATHQPVTPATPAGPRSEAASRCTRGRSSATRRAALPPRANISGA
eukprot:4954395-Alexandrium_andersonii.AAC.1